MQGDQADLLDGCGGLWFLLSSEPVSGGILSQLGLSLLTVYTIFVLAIGREIRAVCTGDVNNTMYTELPACDQLWNLCNDIYTARQHGDFLLEEELYTILILIYRYVPRCLQDVCVRVCLGL